MKKFVAVIMAGGKGQRFWPLSTSERPKQFLDLERCGLTLLQSAFNRLEPLTDLNHILVATSQDYVALVKEQLPDLPVQNILIEPVGRDSAPAIALTSLEIQRRFGDVVAGYFPSDHRIINEEAFYVDVVQALEHTDITFGITTLGITPHFPATGFGYIQTSQPVGTGFKVSRFVEKPNLELANQYLQEGNTFWNAGMFIWHNNTILDELALHCPELFDPLVAAFNQNRIDDVFPSLPKLSIDYAIMEKTNLAYVLPASFDWDDLGNWLALERLLESQQDDNTVVGTHVGYDAHHNIIFSEDENDIFVTVGIENLVIAKQGNTILLMRKDRVQDIKHVLQDSRMNSLSLTV